MADVSTAADVVARFAAFAEGSDLKPDLENEAAWEEAIAVLREIVADDCVFAWVAPGVRNERIGLQGLRDGWLEWFEAFEGYRSRTEEIRVVDDERVVVFVEQVGKLPGGPEIPMKAAGLARVVGGKLVAMEFNASRDEVLAAIE